MVIYAHFNLLFSGKMKMPDKHFYLLLLYLSMSLCMNLNACFIYMVFFLLLYKVLIDFLKLISIHR